MAKQDCNSNPRQLAWGFLIIKHKSMEQITKIKTAIHINQTYKVAHEGDWRKLHELTTILKQVAALIEHVKLNPGVQPKVALRLYIKGQRIVATTRKNENVFSTQYVTIYSKTIQNAEEQNRTTSDTHRSNTH